ncbi:DUF533 domain-containing protein [Aneurinibacillus terranovensis]|uniref:DUF533 domain-containing protein n=1 Tax=Aneurinibacillus terranovensis TaxID=278991 RepID=UPI000413FAF5|nr:DUF533 domain-containing protein [Aneurinibacillus terranovensis]
MYEPVSAAEHPQVYEIRLLICVAQADGYLDKEEKEKIFQQVHLDMFSVRERQIFHDDIENPKDPIAIANEVGPHLSYHAKLMLTRKMFKLADMGEGLTEEETTAIYQIARCLGLKEEKIREIEHWVVEGMAWIARWDEIAAE